jgi:hypothetical protein
VFGRQEQEADRLVVRHVRQAGFQRAARGAAASGVTVEREDHGVGLAQQLLHVNGVQAVPSVATALANPSWASATTSM